MHYVGKLPKETQVRDRDYGRICRIDETTAHLAGRNQNSTPYWNHPQKHRHANKFQAGQCAALNRCFNKMLVFCCRLGVSGIVRVLLYYVEKLRELINVKKMRNPGELIVPRTIHDKNPEFQIGALREAGGKPVFHIFGVLAEFGYTLI